MNKVLNKITIPLYTNRLKPLKFYNVSIKKVKRSKDSYVLLIEIPFTNRLSIDQWFEALAMTDKQYRKALRQRNKIRKKGIDNNE